MPSYGYNGMLYTQGSDFSAANPLPSLGGVPSAFTINTLIDGGGKPVFDYSMYNAYTQPTADYSTGYQNTLYR